MSLKYVALLLLASLGLCCSADTAKPPKVAHYDAPAEILWLHADISFSPYEREEINEAAARIEQQSRGLLWVVLDYDLDFTDVGRTESLQDANLLLRMDTNDVADAVVVGWMESNIKLLPNSLLGIRFVDFNRGGSDTLWLVVNRLPGHRMFVSVAMHEMLHGLGLAHVKDDSALMNAEERRPIPTTCLHKSDVVEMCAHYDCVPAEIGWCDE